MGMLHPHSLRCTSRWRTLCPPLLPPLLLPRPLRRTLRRMRENQVEVLPDEAAQQALP